MTTMETHITNKKLISQDSSIKQDSNINNEGESSQREVEQGLKEEKREGEDKEEGEEKKERDEKERRSHYKRIAAEILGVPCNDQWNIVDVFYSDEQNKTGALIMVHYDSNADMSYYGHIRGIVIDVELRIVVANSYEYTPSAIVDSLSTNSNGEVIIQDTDGKEHYFDEKTATFRHGLEGVVVRLFKWRGHVFQVSHRRFDISRSCWGDSRPFRQIYFDLGCPETLFEEQEDFSPYVHFFLLVNDGVFHVSKFQASHGFAFYLEYRCMWSPDSDGPFRVTSFDSTNQETVENDNRFNVGYVNPLPQVPDNMRSKIPSLDEELSIITAGEKLPCIRLDDLTIQQANTVLRYGYLQPIDDNNIDPRLRTGEFVVAYKDDGSLLRIESPAYYWRASISNDDPNRRHRFYELLRMANIRPVRGKTVEERRQDNIRFMRDLMNFRRMFPPMTVYPIEYIGRTLQQGPIYLWDNSSIVPTDDDPNCLKSIRGFKERLYNIWACLLVASPYNRQIEIVDFYQRYFTDYSLLVKWVDENQDEIVKQDPEEVDNRLLIYSDRLKEIVNMVNNRVKQQKVPFSKGLTQLLYNEYGESLYRLIREMERHKRFKSNQSQSS